MVADRVDIKEKEKLNKCLAKKPTILWNMAVTIGTLETLGTSLKSQGKKAEEIEIAKNWNNSNIIENRIPRKVMEY